MRSPAHEHVDLESLRSVLRRNVMLYTIAVILLVLWLLGLVSGYTIGAFIHVLLVIAVVLFLVGLLSGRRVV
jgi:di/tricarboxylate transporter